MEPKITYGGEELQGYQPPVLFPDIAQYRGQLRYDYVREMIEFYARTNDLCLTDMLAQPAHIRDLCGMIIKGIEVDPDQRIQRRADRDIDPEVLATKIKIKVIDGRAPSVKFKRGVVAARQRTSLVSPSGKPMGVGMDSGNSVSWSDSARRNVDEVVDYQSTEAVMRLADAWICLSKHGENCFRCPSQKQSKKWLYREVNEDGSPRINRARPSFDEPAEERPARRARA